MTIKDIAQLAGVSVATVSYVLNGKNKVSIATRNRVLRIIDEVAYKSNGAARDLKTHNTNIIAVCLERINGYFFSELIAGMEQATVYVIAVVLLRAGILTPVLKENYFYFISFSLTTSNRDIFIYF